MAFAIAETKEEAIQLITRNASSFCNDVNTAQLELANSEPIIHNLSEKVVYKVFGGG